MDVNGTVDKISIDHLKPAFLPTSQFGRVSRPPSRLQLRPD